MALITGTSGDDILKGTPGDDTLVAGGGTDLLLGKGGADTYALEFRSTHVTSAPSYTINEKAGGDASVDTITGLGALVQYTYGSGYDYTSFSRGGSDGQHLFIDTAAKAGGTAYTAGTIKIANQHSLVAPGAQIELLVAGGIQYTLLTTNTGSSGNDILTGWKLADTIDAGTGDDYVSGGKGGDILSGQGGNDHLFGDAGADTLNGNAGNDLLFGGNGNDRLNGGDGDDTMCGENGKDILRGNDGIDTLDGGAGNDRMIGGNGNDRLIGGSGNDIMTGNKGGDTYAVSSLGDGSDTIIDRGDAARKSFGWLTWNMDEVEFSGYADLDEAVHNLGIGYSGDDLILTYTNPAAPGSTGQITVQDHFLGDRFALEQVDFGTGGYTAIYHIAFLDGDDYTYSVHGGSDVGGNDIVLGSTGDDEIYAGLGDDIVFGGGGADHFMFHDEEDNSGGTDLILDFDLTDDILDFTDIAGFGFGDLTVTTSADGNALITSIYGAIELAGIAALDVSAAIFDFN